MSNLVFAEVVHESILEEMLDTYYYSSQINVYALDYEGQVLKSSGKELKFCKWFKNCTDNKYCIEAHLKASRIAFTIGEVYIFFCPAGLIHWTTPIIKNEVFLGALMAGPILMEYPNNLIVDDIIQDFDFDLDQKITIINALRQIIVIGPTQVRYYAKLLEYLSLILTCQGIDSKVENREKNLQQSQLNDAIQWAKSNNSYNYPYEKERELYAKVRLGDVNGAKTVLNEILGNIFFVNCKDLNIIKSRIIELCSVLSRAAIEGGAPIERIFDINSNYILELKDIDSIEDLSFSLVNVLDEFTKNVLKVPKTNNKEIIQKSIEYIVQNYSSKLTLDTVAEEVHLNPTYFSTLFKKETGDNFSNYVNKVRIKEAKRLLQSPQQLSILDVAISTGFEDQSYFSKVFKNIVGISPKQYQNLHI